jgi:prephenate dehydrogenase
VTSRTVVIGVGLVGASIGMALTKAGRVVHLSDRLPSHAIVAASLGAGVTAPAPPDEVALVVVAVPPAALAKVVVRALTTYPRAVVTDVGSVKAAVLADLEASGLPLDRYVGSHPMAGSQHTGPLTARANLFVDRTWVVTPHRGSAADSVVVARPAVTCGNRAWNSTCGHDEAVTQVSPAAAAVVAGCRPPSTCRATISGWPVRASRRTASRRPTRRCGDRSSPPTRSPSVRS